MMTDRTDSKEQRKTVAEYPWFVGLRKTRQASEENYMSISKPEKK